MRQRPLAQAIQPLEAFSRKMRLGLQANEVPPASSGAWHGAEKLTARACPRRTKPPEKRRCGACVGEKEEAGYEAPEAPEAPANKLSELQQLCAETAREAEQVTGLKAARGAGRGRGRGRR